MKTGTIIGLAVGGLALGITAVVVIPKIFNKSNNSGTGNGDSGSSDNTGNTSTTSGGCVAGAVNTAMNVFNQGSNVASTASEYTKKYKVGRIDEDATAKDITIFFASPRPVGNSVPKGRKVKLSNMGKYDGIYTVKSTWTDTAGNQGAIYIATDKVTESRESNTAYENKGEILTY